MDAGTPRVFSAWHFRRYDGENLRSGFWQQKGRLKSPFLLPVKAQSVESICHT
jgi:hypothetical protein